jgi:acetolactate synthase-1/3 small subunit
MLGSRKAFDEYSSNAFQVPDFSLAPPCRNASGTTGHRATARSEATTPTGAPLTHHTLSVLVENRPGVLTRCAGLFARRGFNIDSLAVGTTEDPRRSRITIRVACEQHSIEQVVKQLYKLVDVLKVQELDQTAVELELLMIKVTSSPDRRPEIISLAEVFEARVVDVGPEAVTFSCVAGPDRLQALEELMEPYGIRELVRTGRIALDRDGLLGKRKRMRVVA